MKPEFWLDRKLARKLSRDERMLYMGLWNQADEHGRALGDPVVVKGAVFPYDDDLTVVVIDRMLDALDLVGVVQRYEVDGDPYLFLPKLKDHQRLEPGKSKSKHPEPPARVDPPGSEVVSDCSEKTVAVSELVSESASEVGPEIGNEPASFGLDQPERINPSAATIFSDESAQDPGKKSLLYGSGSMEQGGVSQTVLRETKSPPKPHCDKHPEGTPEPCGPCAGARKRWIAFNLERDQLAAADAAEKARAERERTHQAAEDRRRAIADCPMCDADGYCGASLCDHNPRAVERDRRGLARARIAACRLCDADGLRADGSDCDHGSSRRGSSPDPSPSVSVPTGRSESAPHDEPTTQENQIHA